MSGKSKLVKKAETAPNVEVKQEAPKAKPVSKNKTK
jgi:hypothetical protein